MALVCRCNCTSASGEKKKKFRDLHTFNDHHIVHHRTESQVKRLIRACIHESDLKLKHCKICVKNQKMKSFDTHKSMLSHYVRNHFSMDANQRLYDMIDEALPIGDSSEEEDGDDASTIASARSTTSSHYSTDSGRSGSTRDSNAMSVASNYYPMAPMQQMPPQVPFQVPIHMLPTGALSQDQFVHQTGNTDVLSYYIYLGQIQRQQAPQHYSQQQAPVQKKKGPLDSDSD
jgi:hypothetical protein